MATLKYVREVKNSNLLSLGISEGEETARYTVGERIYLEIGSPAVGSMLDGEQISRLMEADELYRARKKALSLLAFADNNERNLRMKLARAGFSRDICDAVTSEMVERGYINEKNQLERLVLNEANSKLRGPLRIIPALTAKGYSSGDVREVMHALVDSGEIDFKKNAMALIEKKLPLGDAEEKKKLLYKNGYKI